MSVPAKICLTGAGCFHDNDGDAQLEALYGAKLAIFQDRDSGESAFLPG